MALERARLRAWDGFILLGEYGDMPAELTLKAQELTLKLHKDKSEARDVRRRALEALANSSHPEASKLIRAAYEHGNHELKVGAIFAMGNTCNRMWAKMLLEELVSRDSECVFEAVRACGQIQLRDSVQRVGELTLSDDQNIQEIAIWSLGEIGGKQAFERLNSLAENVEDDSAAAVIDEALDAASFSLTFASLDLDLEDD